ncbi:hypothetical protein Pmani_002338 [Petrolisthes manimaculis]|uniref:Uncharacterized protein n=1 Tax=Petrolisthes manimaculis TaxID=1843537 RepID=A0AAE1UJG2_9EUCA|nr:hypothetical protein Pmani_002338 [Petrolisthes manimaculis]
METSRRRQQRATCRHGEYQLLKDYAELGQNLVYTGDELKQFVSELHNQERQRRTELREEDQARHADEE